MQLNDSVLSLCSYQEDDQHQVFAGLADGTMAVIEVCHFLALQGDMKITKYFKFH